MCLITFSKKDESWFSKKIKEFNKINSFTWSHVEINNHCTHKCNFCYWNFFNEKNKHNMSIEDFTILCEKLKSIWIVQIWISWWEPLEHPNFNEILKIANNYNFIIHITTNWELLDDIEFKNSIIKNNIDQIQINYQWKDIHDIVHWKKWSYEKMVKWITSLKWKVRTVATIVLTKYNLSKIDNMLSEIVNIWFDRIRIWDSTWLWKKYLNYDINKLKNIYEEVWKKILKLWFNNIVSYENTYKDVNYYVPCPAIKKFLLALNSNWDVLFCSTTPDYIIWNIFKEDFNDIIKKYDNEIHKIKTTKGNICFSRGF